MVVTQHCYRWGNNNSIATRTWRNNLNTPATNITQATLLRLRFHIYSGAEEYVALSQAHWTVYVATSASGTYYKIIDTVNALGWQFANGDTDADGTDITTPGDEWISTGQAPDNDTGDQYTEDGGDYENNQSLGHVDLPPVGGETDIEYAIIGSGATLGQTYYFRVRQLSNTLGAYTQTAQATMEDPFPSLTQYSFRIGKETTIPSRNAGSSNWLAAVNGNYTINTPKAYEDFRLRFHITEGNAFAATDSFKLYYSINGGAYSILTGAGDVKYVDGATDTDGDNIGLTVWISDTAKSEVVSGDMYCDTSNDASVDLTKNYETELEWCIRLDDNLDGDYIDFRVRYDATVFTTYSNTPRITFNTVSSSYTQTNYRWAKDSDLTNRLSGDWLATLNTKPTISLSGQTLRLRTHIKTENANYPSNWSMYWSTNQTTWYQITDSSSTWRADVNGTDNNDSDPIPSGYWITSDGGYINVTGEYNEQTTNAVIPLLDDYGADLETEFEHCIRPVPGDIGETTYYFRITYGADTGTSNVYAQIETEYSVGTSDRNVSVDIATRSDRDVEVDIHRIQRSLDLCYYDTGNNRWTDGSYGGNSVKVINNVTKVVKNEELNKLSSLKFEIFDYDENWGIEEGAIIALGEYFMWG